MSVPNLDGMTEAELTAFWGQYHRPSRKDAAELVGGPRRNYISLAQRLANYAINRATMMQCRIQGDIQAANLYESIADRIYDELPSDVRW